MVAKQLAWLAALLVATPTLDAACGGRSSSDDDPIDWPGAGATGGSTGTGGSTKGSGGGAATTGTGGSTGGSGGSGGTGGGIGDSGAADGRMSCGTVVNGCTANPNGNTICDLANNRCVQCLTDPDCAGQATNKTCDTRPSGMTMLPADRCVQCIDATQCPPGATCSMANTCTTPCGTMTCSTQSHGQYRLRRGQQPLRPMPVRTVTAPVRRRTRRATFARTCRGYRREDASGASTIRIAQRDRRASATRA